MSGSRILWVGIGALLSGACGSAASGQASAPNGAGEPGATVDGGGVAGPVGPSSLLSAGLDHTCVVADGAVKCWGQNVRGQLGDGTTTSRPKPALVRGLASGVTAVTAGRTSTCALLDGGTVKCWGGNLYGQLGDRTGADQLTPVDVVGLAGVVAISAGDGHTCALLDGGGVKCWGSNTGGRIGDGTEVQRIVPTTPLGLASGVVAISAGSTETCAALEGGEVRCWGPTADVLVPTRVSGLATATAAVTAADNHTCAVLSTGGAQCWGSNDSGQLGDGTRALKSSPTDVQGLSRGVTAISAGDGHTCALLAVGGVRCWGTNVQGELGSGSTSDLETSPVAASGLSSGVKALAAGANHTCVLRDAGDVQCWGLNRYGQLGDGTLEDRRTPVTVAGL